MLDGPASRGQATPIAPPPIISGPQVSVLVDSIQKVFFLFYVACERKF